MGPEPATGAIPPEHQLAKQILAQNIERKINPLVVGREAGLPHALPERRQATLEKGSTTEHHGAERYQFPFAHGNLLYMHESVDAPTARPP